MFICLYNLNTTRCTSSTSIRRRVRCTSTVSLRSHTEKHGSAAEPPIFSPCTPRRTHKKGTLHEYGRVAAAAARGGAAATRTADRTVAAGYCCTTQYRYFSASDPERQGRAGWFSSFLASFYSSCCYVVYVVLPSDPCCAAAAGCSLRPPCERMHDGWAARSYTWSGIPGAVLYRILVYAFCVAHCLQHF